jgi:hypothetical protein
LSSYEHRTFLHNGELCRTDQPIGLPRVRDGYYHIIATREEHGEVLGPKHAVDGLWRACLRVPVDRPHLHAETLRSLPYLTAYAAEPDDPYHGIDQLAHQARRAGDPVTIPQPERRGCRPSS